MIKTFIVDSFTNEAFKGNPAGVCLIDSPLEEKKMLSIAKELGLSETAFVLKAEKENIYTIRYFSPVMEIPLCGHATLASAKVMFKIGKLDSIVFTTIQNIRLDISKVGEEIKMIFPVYGTVPAEAPQALLAALGIESVINAAYNKETEILLLEIESDQILKDLKPSFTALVESHSGINGVLVTAKSSNTDYDFQSRYFWPWSGTNEDPVTGGTHTFLAKYWAERLGKQKMKSFQCSTRTGFMTVDLLNEQSMSIQSQAVIVFEGLLQI